MATPVKHFFEQFFAETFTKAIQNRLKNVFKNLELCKMRYGNAMNVLYCHVLCPHEPVIFTKQAKNLCFSGMALVDDTRYFLDKETHKLYCENVYGIDNLVLESIKKILKQYKTEPIKPIIVLHSDHSILKGAKNFKDPCVTVDTAYGNLFALYIPDEWKQDTKDLQFINLYRWVFNHLFSEKFEYFKESKQCGW